MKQAKNIVSGVAWTVINNVVSIVYGIISVPFLISYFGKEEYGLIGLALSVNVYIHLLDMGMTNTNVRFFSEFIAKGEETKVQRLLGTNNLVYLLIGLLNTVILFGLSFCTSSLFEVTPEQAETLRNLLWILGLNATFSWLSVCFDQYLTANKLIVWIKKRSVFLKVMQFVVLAMTIFFKFGIEVYFLSYIFMATIILPWTLLKTKEISPTLKINFRFDKTVFKETFPYALSIFSFSIFQFMAFNFRPLFLGNMSGPSAVADFNVMNAIATVVTVLSSSFMQVLLPIVTELRVKNDGQQINAIVKDGTKYVCILLSSVVFMLIVSMPELLTLYVGEEYVNLTFWVDMWLLTLLLSHRNVMTSLVFTERKVRSVAYMGAVAMIIALVSYWLFIPIYGVGGVVIGFLLHELTHTLFYYVWFLPRKFKFNTFDVFLKSVLPVWTAIAICSIIVGFVLSLLDGALIKLVLLKTVSIAFLIMAVSFLLLLNKKDKGLLRSMVKKQL